MKHFAPKIKKKYPLGCDFGSSTVSKILCVFGKKNQNVESVIFQNSMEQSQSCQKVTYVRWRGDSGEQIRTKILSSDHHGWISDRKDDRSSPKTQRKNIFFIVPNSPLWSRDVK